MSTPRLINETRERIQKALLIRRFRKLINEVTEKRAHLINQVYLDLYTPEIRRKMAELPKGWLPEETGLDVRFGSSGTGYVRILFTGTFHGFLQRYADYKKEVVCHRIQQRHKGICVKSYEDTHLFSIRFQELEDERNKLEETVREAERTSMRMLQSTNSFTKLIELWPEIEPFARPYMTGQKPTQLPAVPIHQLNKLLDLPV